MAVRVLAKTKGTGILPMDIYASTLIEELVERFNMSSSAPFLFVGSGLSIRYMGIENWQGLLMRLATLTDRPYHYYSSKAGGDLPRTASYIAEAFHEVWWTGEQYKDERKQFGAQCTTISSPLKLQAAKYTNENSNLDRVPQGSKPEIDLLRKARINGIITTNWDSLLELLFPEYAVYVGQNQALFAHSYGIAEIFKIHGSCTLPDSLILTEEDYQDFNSRNAYLAAKMLTTFLEHPIVFLGYSLGDENIKSIFRSVVECLDKERVELLSKRLLFVQYEQSQHDPILAEATLNLGDRDLRLTTVRAHDFTPIYQALASTEQRLSAKLLRQIKEHLYELVKTNDPSERIAVMDIADLEGRQDIEVVVGVGISGRIGEKGLSPIQIADLYRDVVFHGNEFSGQAKELIETTISNLLRGVRKHVPVFRYLQLAGALDINGNPIASRIPDRVLANALLPRSEFENKSYGNKREETRGQTLDGLVTKLGIRRALPYLTFIDHDLDELQRFLQENIDLLETGNDLVQNSLRKLICIYDRCRFGPGFPVGPSLNHD